MNAKDKKEGLDQKLEFFTHTTLKSNYQGSRKCSSTQHKDHNYPNLAPA